jgi:hypothetical protein
MKIEFDPANKAQLAAVACLIASLRGNSLAPSTPLASLDGDSEQPDTFDDEADPADAFDGPDAEQAFAAPLAAAPVAATPPPPSPAPSPDAPSPGVNLDKSGLPWDARIHASPPSTIKDGTWRRKRGLDEATEQTVIAELRQVMGAPAAAAAQVVPPPPLAQAEPVAAVPATPTPAPPAPPTTPAVVDTASGAPAAIPASDFASLMRRITGAQTSGLLTVEQTKEIAESLGITGVRDLIHRPDLIPSFDALLPVA